MNNDKILILRILCDDADIPFVVLKNKLSFFDLDLGLNQHCERNTEIFFSRKLHYIKRQFPLTGYWEIKMFVDCTEIPISFIKNRKEFIILSNHINIIDDSYSIKYTYFDQISITEMQMELNLLQYPPRCIPQQMRKYFGDYSISDSQIESIDRFYSRNTSLWNVPKDCNPDTFVISGGGIHGISVLGTVYCFRNIIPKINYFYATSSGSIISFFLAIGLEIEEMYELLFSLDSTIKTTDDNLFSSFVLVMSKYSLNNKNDKLESFLENLLISKLGKKELTFRDLFKMKKKILVICGTCLNNGKAEYFSVATHPDMNIVKAIMISTCLPVIWSPQVYENKVYVDGGVVDNTPVFEAMRNCYLEIYKLLEINPEETRDNLLKIYWKPEVISTMKIINSKNILCFDIRKDLSKQVSTNEIMKSFPVYFSYILDSLSSISTISYIPNEFKRFIIPTYVPFDIASRDLNISNSMKEHLFRCGNNSGIQYVKVIQEYN